MENTSELAQRHVILAVNAEPTDGARRTQGRTSDEARARAHALAELPVRAAVLVHHVLRRGAGGGLGAKGGLISSRAAEGGDVVQSRQAKAAPRA